MNDTQGLTSGRVNTELLGLADLANKGITALAEGKSWARSIHQRSKSLIAIERREVMLMQMTAKDLLYLLGGIVLLVASLTLALNSVDRLITVLKEGNEGYFARIFGGTALSGIICAIGACLMIKRSREK